MVHTIQKNVLKIFSNPTRVRLMMCLMNPKSVTELLSLCDLSQSALSQHLKILRDGGIVTCQRDGKKQIYSIVDKKMLLIAKLLLEL